MASSPLEGDGILRRRLSAGDLRRLLDLFCFLDCTLAVVDGSGGDRLLHREQRCAVDVQRPQLETILLLDLSALCRRWERGRLADHPYRWPQR